MRRFFKVFYVFFICILYWVVIHAEEENVYTEMSNENANDQHWNLDIPTILGKFHLSSAAKVINTISFKSESDDGGNDDDEKTGPTTAEKYGYGFLSIFIISTFSLAGAVVFPLTKKPYYKYINAFFISLAVGALFSNSLFELLPAIILYDSESKKSSNSTHGNDTHDDHEEPKVPLYLVQMLILVITAYLFYVVEMMINVFINHRNEVTKDTYDLDHEMGPSEATSTIPILPSATRDRSNTILSATFPHLQLVPDEKKPHATGWMIIIGDGIHNVADGLAIGAAFANSIIFGITTSIAIAFQELPSELGEYMILIESGFTFRRALLFNFISACTAFAGFFVGVGLSENEGARTWIFSITAGTFIYIALVDLWPTLMTESPVFDWTRFACVTVGYMVGIFVMFGLAIIT